MKTKKRILSLLLIMFLLLSSITFLSNQVSASDWEECSHCGGYRSPDYLCNTCGGCGEETMNDCFFEYHCPCGACYQDITICDDCGRCPDCIGGYICSDCDKCTECVGFDEYCTNCYKCATCMGVGYCYECDHCGDCTNLCSADDCSRCHNCCDRYCDDCGLCDLCAYDTFCESCEVCLNCFTAPLCSNCGYCSDCASVCPGCGDCCDWCSTVCTGCSQCEDCLSMTLCPDCNECTNCSGATQCEDCGLCSDCTNICEGCEEICDSCSYFCLECNSCINCVGNLCDECQEVCDNCADFCYDCNRCEYCTGNLCDECQEVCDNCADFCYACNRCEYCAENQCETCGSCSNCTNICEGCEEICDACCSDFCVECNRCINCVMNLCDTCGEVCHYCADFCHECNRCENCGEWSHISLNDRFHQSQCSCGHPFDESKSHIFIYQVGKAATATEMGFGELTCQDCNYEETIAIPATGGEEHTHNFSLWVSNLTFHEIYCACGEKNPSTKGDHEFQWVTDVEATIGATGLKHQECAVCGYQLPEEIIPPITTYEVTVNSGTGSGNYAAGTTVNITAGTPATGKVFDKWTTTDGVVVADANSATTTFTMPAKAVSVTATYKDAPVATYAVTVNSGTGDGNFAEGATVSITAGLPATDKVFDKWITSDGVTFANANSATTTFVMPAKEVTVTATYRYISSEIPDYKIISGENGIWKKATTIGIVIISNGDYEDFTGVSVDNILIDSSNYTSASGSTVVTLKPTYLETLAVGTHKVALKFGNYSAQTNLTILAADERPDESKPDESKPGESKPDESKPVESKPDESKPVESKPDENKPVESKPVESKPYEIKHDEEIPKTGEGINPTSLLTSLILISGSALIGVIRNKKKKKYYNK